MDKSNSNTRMTVEYIRLSKSHTGQQTTSYHLEYFAGMSWPLPNPILTKVT